MTIQIQRRMSGSPGAPAALKSGQLAWNSVDQTFYLGDGDDGSGNATSIKAIAGDGATVNRSSTQSVGGAKTFTAAVALQGGGTVNAPANNDNSTAIPSTAWVRGQNYLTGNQAVTISGDASGSGATAINLVLANTGVTAGTFTKLTVDAKGRVTAGAALAAGDIPNIATSQVTGFDAQVRTSRLDQMAAPTAAVNFNGQRLTGAADPVNNSDVVTKSYADALAAGSDSKESCRVATTAAVALSGIQTIDGVAGSAGMRVLVKDQGSPSQNGIYLMAAGAWTRAPDADSNTDVTTGLDTFIEEGTVNAGRVYKLITAGPITLGSTNLTFSIFGGGTTYLNGNGLDLTGSTFSVRTANSGRIAVGAGGVDLATTGVTAGSYRTVTVDAYGRITGGSNPTTLSGYGIADAQPLDAELTALASLNSAADQLPYFSGAGSAALTTLTTFGRSLIDDANAAAARTTLGLGSVATQNANAVNLTGGTISSAVTVDDGTF